MSITLMCFGLRLSARPMDTGIGGIHAANTARSTTPMPTAQPRIVFKVVTDRTPAGCHNALRACSGLRWYPPPQPVGTTTSLPKGGRSAVARWGVRAGYNQQGCGNL
jgi:hypothetical protein